MSESNAAAAAQTITTQSQLLLPLQDRVAIVTGGSRGIGRAICLHLASLGSKIVINYSSNSSQANHLASLINNNITTTSSSSSSSSSSSTAAGNIMNPPRAITVKADVSDPDQVKSLFDAAESAFSSRQPPHILVNSAGVLDPKYPNLFDTTLEDFERTFRVNTRGAFLCMKEASKRLKRGGGSYACRVRWWGR